MHNFHLIILILLHYARETHQLDRISQHSFKLPFPLPLPFPYILLLILSSLSSSSSSSSLVSSSNILFSFSFFHSTPRPTSSSTPLRLLVCSARLQRTKVYTLYTSTTACLLLSRKTLLPLLHCRSKSSPKAKRQETRCISQFLFLSLRLEH